MGTESKNKKLPCLVYMVLQGSILWKMTVTVKYRIKNSAVLYSVRMLSIVLNYLIDTLSNLQLNLPVDLLIQ
jgi:hypothetical protein